MTARIMLKYTGFNINNYGDTIKGNNMKDQTSVEVERHPRQEILIITQCPVCHGSVGAVYSIKDNTVAVKVPCVHCGSLLLVPVTSGHNKVIRKGSKK